MITKIGKAGGGTGSLNTVIPASIVKMMGLKKGDLLLWNYDQEKKEITVKNFLLEK